MIGNIGLDFGGALVCYNGLLDIQNSTVAGNDANYGSALNLREAALTMKNSIFWEIVKIVFMFPQVVNLV